MRKIIILLLIAWFASALGQVPLPSDHNRVPAYSFVVDFINHVDGVIEYTKTESPQSFIVVKTPESLSFDLVRNMVSLLVSRAHNARQFVPWHVVEGGYATGVYINAVVINIKWLQNENKILIYY